MIENTDNIIQIICTGLCTFYSVYRAVFSGRREWVLLGLFSGAFFLGDVYYLLYLNLYADSSFDSNIPYLCWYTSYYFMILLILYIKDTELIKRPPAYMFLIPVFTGGMCLFFISKGDVISNLITFLLMTIMMWHSASGLKLLELKGDQQNPKKWIYIATIFFCILEYALWTASCFWTGDRITNLYFWFDIMISANFILFAAAMRKAVDR